MPKNRPVRLVYALVVTIALVLISRNLYHRYLNNALIAAVKAGDLSTTRRLLRYGADPNFPMIIRAEDGRLMSSTPLLNVAFNKLAHTPLASTMLIGAHNAGLDSGNQDANAEAITSLLIRHGAQVQNGGYLQRACQLGDVALTRLLLDHGLDPNAPSNSGALDLAINYYLDVIRLPNSPQIPATPAPNVQAQAAQHLETSHQLVSLLLEHGARLTLAQALAIGDTATVKQMLDGSMPGIAQGGYFMMVRAADEGDLDTIRQLLQRGIDPNRYHQPTFEWMIPGLVNDTPLNRAVSKGHVEAIKLLLAHGADPNGFSPYGTVPVDTAAGADNIALVQLLLTHKADPNLAHQYGLPALASAAGTGDVTLVKLLLAHGAKLTVDGHSSALEAAIWRKRPAMVRFLLAQGASTATAPESRLPVLTQALQHLPEVVPDLLKHGAPVNLPPMPKRKPGVAINMMEPAPIFRREGPNSPLIAAVWYAPQYESTLVRAGAKIGADRSFICVVAVRKKRLDLLPKLLAYGADVNGTDRGDTALSVCVETAPEAARLLLDHGANPNVLSQEMWAPLQDAARRGDTALVRLLLAHGAQVNAHVRHGHTALYWARRKNHPDVVALLQQAGGQE